MIHEKTRNKKSRDTVPLTFKSTSSHNEFCESETPWEVSNLSKIMFQLMHTNISCLAGVWSCLLLQQSAYFSLQSILSVLYLYISDTEVGALSTEHS
jgi:hypothetical protein